IFAFCNAAAVSIAVEHGFGQQASQLSGDHIKATRKALLVGELFFYLCAALSSLSVIEFLIQIQAAARMIALDIFRIIAVIWAVVVLIVMAIFIGLELPSMTRASFIALSTIDCVFSISTFILAFLVALPLQTKWQTKARVLLGFSPALLVVITTILSLVYLPPEPVHNNFTKDSLRFVILSEVTILLLIVFCTAAPLFQIGRQFKTGYNVPIIDENHTMSGSGTRNKLGSRFTSSYDLTSITRSKLSSQQKTFISSSISGRENRDKNDIRRERSVNAHRERNQGDGESMNSDSSQKIIIRKTVEQHSSQM
ncbi:MAG: hypothetical protein FE78DRAFT_542392, partial [Acidomyces sp. 'richmondensis']